MISLATNAENDLFLDPLTGSIARAKDAQEVAQHVRSRLLFYLGEWFLDIETGMPWFQRIFAKPANLTETEARMKSEIQGTPGVLKIDTFELIFDRTTRKVRVAFSLTTTYGTVESTLTINQAAI